MPKTKLKSKQKQKNKQGAKSPTPELSLKEQQALKRKQERERKKVIQNITQVCSIALVVTLVLMVVAGPKLGIMGGAGVAAVVLSYQYPLPALWFFIAYLPFSGTVTYGFAGGNALAQLAKDGFYFPAMIALFQQLKKQREPLIVPKPLITPIYILLAYCALVLLFVNGAQQFSPDPRGKPILLGLLGLKVFLGYFPLIACTYYMLKTKHHLHWLVRMNCILCIVCCALAMVQYRYLITGVCPPTQGEGADLFKASLEARCFVGGALLYSPSQGQIRLPGTFVAPWQWGWYLISCAFFGFAGSFNDPSLLWRVVGMVSLGFTFVLSVISGQRIALALVPTVIGILLVLTGQVANLKRFIPIAIGLGVVLAGAAISNPAVVEERIASLQGRWGASPPDEFIGHQLEFSIAHAGLLGKGLGRATNSARMFGQTKLIETWFPKVIWEVGLLGFILFMLLMTIITWQSFKTYRSIKNKSLRDYGAAFWVFVLFISYNTYYYPLDVDPVNLYYWIMAGAIFRLPELDRQEKLLEAAQEAENDNGQKKKKQQLKKKKGFP